MEDVLNPKLYRRLVRHFGSARVSNNGQAMVARPVRDADGSPRLYFDQDGEFYSICCPYCQDTKFRLYVNHMFGKTDAHGRRMKFLAICFNEGCLYKDSNADDFRETLEDDGLSLEDVKVKKGVVLPAEARVVQLPGPCTPLDRLRPNHKARQYLKLDRGFDPDLIAQRYGGSYCVDSHYFLARNRIIIPVMERGLLKGWQARHIGELAWKGPNKKPNLPPKYFSCPDSQFRSRCLYNWDKARDWETLVVVEGPTDVWNFGAMSACIFGNTMTPFQRRKVRVRFGDKRTVVILLDPEEYASRTTRALLEEMDGWMPGRVCAVKLVEGTDPGSLDRDVMRDYVRTEAAKHGVKVRYRRVP